tara:strand:+ start:884 stop:1096 length:213 start_codon:yes stop_codon:yes gene_type:complete
MVEAKIRRDLGLPLEAKKIKKIRSDRSHFSWSEFSYENLKISILQLHLLLQHCFYWYYSGAYRLITDFFN